MEINVKTLLEIGQIVYRISDKNQIHSFKVYSIKMEACQTSINPCPKVSVAYDICYPNSGSHALHFDESSIGVTIFENKADILKKFAEQL